MIHRSFRASLALVASMIASAALPAAACTGIRLQAKDGAVVHARTLEFGVQLHSTAIIIPRKLAMHGTGPAGQSALQWETKYAALGLNGLGQTLLVDGVNEKGLAAGLFYMPGYADYQEVSEDEVSRSLAPWELGTWILTNFATIDEVRAAVSEIRVGNVVFADWNFVPPVHYIVHDAAGNSLVIEYVGGKLAMHDNPLGVITNAPEFDWHVKNLSNYLNLSPTNVPPANFDGLKIHPFGQGSGLLGIPGDFTPPSRFVRAAILSRAALAGDDGPTAVEQAFHVLSSFDIAKGDIRQDASGQGEADYTQWTCASDTKNRVFYFHTYDDRRIRRIDLDKVNLDAPQVLSIPLGDREDIQDLTPLAAGQ